MAHSLHWSTEVSPVSKPILVHFGTTLLLLTRMVRVSGCHRSTNSAYRRGLFPGVWLPRELQVETARRVFGRRRLLLEERTVCAGRTPAHSPQHHQTNSSLGMESREARNVFRSSISPTTETRDVFFATNPTAKKCRTEKFSRRQEKCGTQTGR